MFLQEFLLSLIPYKLWLADVRKQLLFCIGLELFRWVIDEADIIKTDGDYIYSISNNEVLITNVKDPKDIKVVSRLKENLPQDLLLYKDKQLLAILQTKLI